MKVEEAVPHGAGDAVCPCIYTQLLLLLLYTKKTRDRRLSVGPPSLPPPSHAPTHTQKENCNKVVMIPAKLVRALRECVRVLGRVSQKFISPS